MRNRLPAILPVTSAGVALTVVFWGGLWAGGGLIGGDLYTYYMPQKAFLAERLHDGEVPLWNNRAGHGYPLVAESQTAPFYPPHLLLYRVFDVNTAYNAVQIVHYVLAFVFTWMYARTIGLSSGSAGLAGLVYAYGWFPPRICLEWAIVGGAWLPLALWLVERHLATRQRRYWIGLAAVLGMQMLAGHFNLAFLTQLTLAVYVPARLWFASRDVPAETLASRRQSLALVAVAVACGFAVAAIQLAPSWELKRLSQRATVGETHNPGYGHIPVWYWSQVVVPWLWYPEDIDLNRALPPDAPRTNQIEAHLYFGLVPLTLMGYALFQVVRTDRLWITWLLLGLAALIYTPGWLLPVTQHIPGFAFFAGPGRFGLITTLAAALISAAGLDRLVAHRRSHVRQWVIGLALAATTCDLWLVCRVWVYGEMVRYATIVPDPPIKRVMDSPVRKILGEHDSPVRLFCRGPNLPTLLGVASTPPYLGIGPAAYFDPQAKLPGDPPFDEPPTAEQIDWLRRAGVTHVLSFSSLDPRVWPVVPLWSGVDPFLNQAWARIEPLYLYALHGGRGRAAWGSPDSQGTIRVTEHRANRVALEAESASGGLLVLTDLAYPGWEAQVDGQPAETEVVDHMYRGVDLPPGRHTIVWAYRPRSLVLGAGVTLATTVGLLGLIAGSGVGRWLRRLDGK